MKARIYHEDGRTNRVTVVEDNPRAKWDDGVPARISTEYFVPATGGYVKIHDEAGRYPQVCERLAGMGSTLHCSNPEKLIDLIRRERRRAIAADRRWSKA